MTVSTTDVTGKDTVVPPALYIKGRVTGSGGVGLPNVEVDARGTDNASSTYTSTSSTGDYAVAVTPGTFILNFYDTSEGAYLGGYYSTSGITSDYEKASRITVSSADVTGRNTTLKAALHIKGKVALSGGASPSGVSAWAEGPSGSESYGSVAADGTYSLAIGPGTYTIYFQDGSGKYGSGFYSSTGFTYVPTGTSNVTVSSADVTGKNVTLPKAVHIKGKVTKSGGAGLSGISVLATGPAGAYQTYSYTAADGTYSVRLLRARTRFVSSTIPTPTTAATTRRRATPQARAAPRRSPSGLPT